MCQDRRVTLIECGFRQSHGFGQAAENFLVWQRLADGLGGRYASHEDEAGSVLVDVYDFTPLMASATLQFHVVQRAEEEEEEGGSWAEFEQTLQKCHAATIVDDMCGINTWMDHHIGFAIHGTNEVQTDAASLKALSQKLGLQFHVTAKNQGGIAVYLIAANGLSMAFQVDEGSYVPPRDSGDGMLDLCSNGACAAK